MYMYMQTLCLSAAVLFYVMTRDKLNTEWDNNGAGTVVNTYNVHVHVHACSFVIL